MIYNRNSLVIVFILFLINYNSCENIYFNIFSKQCTDKSPCSLNDKDNWVGNKLPSNGDSIIIDYSQVPAIIQNSNNNNYKDNIINYSYLHGNNINLNLNSISIIGSDLIYPQLSLDNTKLIVSNGIFQISSSTFNLNNNNSLIIDNSANLEIINSSNFTISQSSSVNIINNSQVNSDKSIKRLVLLNNSTFSMDATSTGNFYSQVFLSSSSLFSSLSSNLNFYNGFYSFSANTSNVNNAKFYSNSYIRNIKINGQIELDSESNAVLSILNNLYIGELTAITINKNSNLVIGGQVNGDSGLANTSCIQLIGGNLKITTPNFKIDNLIFSESNTGSILYEADISEISISKVKTGSSSSSSEDSSSYFVNTNLPNIILSSNSNLVIYNANIKSLIESKSAIQHQQPISFNFFGTVSLETISVTTANVIITPNSNVEFIKGGCLYSLNIFGNLTISSPGILVHPYAINILDESANLVVIQASISAIVNITAGTLLSVGSTSINSIYISGEKSVLALEYSNLYINKDLVTDSKSTINLTSKVSFYNTPTISISSTPELYSNLIINFQVPKNRPSKSGNFSIITYNNNNTSENSSNNNNDNNSAINFSSIKIIDLNNDTNNNNNNNTGYSYSISTDNNGLSLLFTFTNYKTKFPEWATILIIVSSIVCIITISIIIYTIKQKRKLQIEYEYTRI